HAEALEIMANNLRLLAMGGLPTPSSGDEAQESSQEDTLLMNLAERMDQVEAELQDMKKTLWNVVMPKLEPGPPSPQKDTPAGPPTSGPPSPPSSSANPTAEPIP
ncbi:MAG: hypothetical protein MUP14_02955, partial [Dehalococcoidia bacterium]|nr:hypothetical protein [Dehalococcoidia bacterium]